MGMGPACQSLGARRPGTRDWEAPGGSSSQKTAGCARVLLEPSRLLLALQCTIAIDLSLAQSSVWRCCQVDRFVHSCGVLRAALDLWPPRFRLTGSAAPSLILWREPGPSAHAQGTLPLAPSSNGSGSGPGAGRDCGGVEAAAVACMSCCGLAGTDTPSRFLLVSALSRAPAQGRDPCRLQEEGLARPPRQGRRPRGFQERPRSLPLPRGRAPAKPGQTGPGRPDRPGRPDPAVATAFHSNLRAVSWSSA